MARATDLEYVHSSFLAAHIQLNIISGATTNVQLSNQLIQLIDIPHQLND